MLNKYIFTVIIIQLFWNCTKTLPKIESVVILGNSIVWHQPEPSIGWNYDWGMAASSQDRDFVHLLTKDIHFRDNTVSVKFANIADFERNWRAYNLHSVDSLKGADMYIFRLSENVPDTATNFLQGYSDLINYVNTKKGVTIVVDGFFPNPLNGEIKQFAIDKGYEFVENQDLTNLNATGLFLNQGVAAHPSDEGMKQIEERIWDCINLYF